MQLPLFLQGESRARLFQGFVAGAVATMVLGFGWGGWMLGSTAAKQSADDSRSAVVAALAPICADNFQAAANAEANLADLKKEASYKQAKFVEDGGWAVLPGSDKASDGVARACAAILSSME